MSQLIRELAFVLVALAPGCERAPDSAAAIDADADHELRQGFIPSPDLGPGGVEGLECSLFKQDCPAGFKCTPWSNDGDTTLDATKCLEVADEARSVGETCMVVLSSFSGIDDCERGATCWFVDPSTNEGRCVALPTVSEANPSCPNPLEGSVRSAGIDVCLPQCRPLLSECPPGQGCYLTGASLTCAQDVSSDAGNVGDPCSFQQECRVGLACSGCGDGGCCLPYCDTSAPECPDGTRCVPFPTADPLPPGGEDLGLCLD